jgi:hypothetical protein
LQSEGIEVVFDSADLLGSAVGATPHHIETCIQKSLLKINNELIDRITHTSMPAQHAMLLLRNCLLPRLNFVLRTVTPTAITEITRLFDTSLITACKTILQLHQSRMTPQQHIQLTLRCGQGGFGLTPTSITRFFAYLSSLANAFHFAN